MSMTTQRATASSGAQRPIGDPGSVLAFLRRRWPFLVAVVIAIAYPVIESFQLIGPGSQAREYVLVGAGVYVLMALGLNIVVGYAGLLDLGYVAFFALGAYSYAIANFGNIIVVNGQRVGYLTPGAKSPPGTVEIHLAVWPMLVGGLLVAAVFGVLLGAPTLRLRGDYLAIVTLGFGEIVPAVFHNNPALGGAFGYTGLDLPTTIPTPFGPIDFTFLDQTPYYYFVLALIAMAVLVVISIRNSRFGRAWIAIREDETAAAASGVNLVRTKLLAFAMGAALGGVAGVFFASHLSTVTYDQFDFSISIQVLLMVVLGGMGSIPGVMVGAVVVYWVDFYLLGSVNSFFHDHGISKDPSFDLDNIRNLLYGLVLIIMMVLRPEGLIPSARRKREIHEQEIRPEDGAVDALDAPPGLGIVGNPDGELHA